MCCLGTRHSIAPPLPLALRLPTVPASQPLLLSSRIPCCAACRAAGALNPCLERPRPVWHQTAARVQVTALGKGAAAGGAGDWDDKPASESWSEQEQHKKARTRQIAAAGRRGGGALSWGGVSRAGALASAVLPANLSRAPVPCMCRCWAKGGRTTVGLASGNARWDPHACEQGGQGGRQASGSSELLAATAGSLHLSRRPGAQCPLPSPG